MSVIRRIIRGGNCHFHNGERNGYDSDWGRIKAVSTLEIFLVESAIRKLSFRFTIRVIRIIMAECESGFFFHLVPHYPLSPFHPSSNYYLKMISVAGCKSCTILLPWTKTGHFLC